MENNEEINIPALEELKSMVREESPFIAKKPYSMHIVNLALIILSNEYGDEEASKIVKELELDDKGWRVYVDKVKGDPIVKKEQTKFNVICLKDFREMNK